MADQQLSPDSKSIIFGRKGLVWIFSILVSTFVALSGQWSDMQGFFPDYLFLYLDKCV